MFPKLPIAPIPQSQPAPPIPNIPRIPTRPEVPNGGLGLLANNNPPGVSQPQAAPAAGPQGGFDQLANTAIGAGLQSSIQALRSQIQEQVGVVIN